MISVRDSSAGCGRSIPLAVSFSKYDSYVGSDIEAPRHVTKKMKVLLIYV